MNLKSLIKKGLNIIFSKRTIHVTANVTKMAPSDLLKGRCALITGGTSGIGLAISNAMLDAGADVIITGRNEQNLNEAFNQLVNNNIDREKRVFFEIMDIRDVNSFDIHFNNILKKIGNRKIDILCNNAGVQSGVFGKTSEQQFDDVLATNLKGTYFLSQIIAKYMVDNKIEGNVLNIASSSSLRPANSPYILSKWGIRALTIGLAKTLIPHRIVVNGIAPGPTATKMLIKDPNRGIENPKNPLGRMCTTDEIANMAVILTSGIGRSIVGDIVYMTGGAGIITFDDLSYNI
ncbi:MAG: SDR family oxidoreductase [Paludibacteraceae bacterium]|nr:SDR family oxidoreductase [Paludibacteraceae bacterium]